MTSLVLIYVYYDKTGDIKAITPVPDDNLSSEFEYTMLALAEVEGFLRGQKNSFDYRIKKIYTAAGDAKHALVKKHLDVAVTRSLDSYLTQVSEIEASNSVIQIITNPNTCKITLLLNKDYKALQETGTIEEREGLLDFAESGPSTVYITRKNNPYHLLYTLSFVPKLLLDETRMEFKYPETIDLRNSSAYTKRLVSNYVYAVRKGRNVV